MFLPDVTFSAAETVVWQAKLLQLPSNEHFSPAFNQGYPANFVLIHLPHRTLRLLSWLAVATSRYDFARVARRSSGLSQRFESRIPIARNRWTIGVQSSLAYSAPSWRCLVHARVTFASNLLILSPRYHGSIRITSVPSFWRGRRPRGRSCGTSSALLRPGAALPGRNHDRGFVLSADYSSSQHLCRCCH